MIIKPNREEVFLAIGNPTTKRIGRKDKAKNYAKIHVAFDIETTRKNERSYMYIWQMQINEYTIIGRTWEQFENVVSWLAELPYTIIVWVANLSFEFAFLMHRFEINDLFAKETRQPLKFEINNLEFRDALAISGGSLSQLAKDYTKTQKLVGELDYTIERNSTTELSPEEISYCVNDVVILKEFSEFLWDKYINNGFIPITKTGILRKEVKESARKWCHEQGFKVSRLHDAIFHMFPKTAKEYNFDMEYLFRGGFTHANNRYVGEVVEGDLLGIDFISSYPSVMFKNYVPVTPFTPSKFSYGYMKKYCCKMIITFGRVEAKTTHTIESKNKVLRHSKNTIWDNGRLLSGTVTLYLTELDFDTFRRFYSWKKIVVHSFEIAKRGYMPKYLLDVLYKYYKGKNDLKKKGLQNTQEYAISKSMVNSTYGLCVTRLCFKDISFNNGEWGMKPVEKTYEEMIKNEILSPYFGIYITAHSRHNETLTLFDMHDPEDGHDVIYSDTDSHKLTDDFFRPYIDTYNNMTILENAKMCYRLGYDMSVLWDIGCFDYESNMTRFATLGAKRYIYTDKKGLHQTISGLGKMALVEYCNDKNLNPFAIFNDRMFIPSDYTHKLRSIYNEEPHEDIIDGETMHEESSVALVPVEFTLKLANDYIKLLGQLYDRTMRRIS